MTVGRGWYALCNEPEADGQVGDDSSAPVQAELDPPPGPRRGWLDSVLGKHAFVVLVFYRGFW